MEIPDDLFIRLKALLKVLDASCKECCRPKSMCYECDYQAVPYLYTRMVNAETGKNQRLQYGSRFDIYEQEIRKAGRPLLAKEIDPQKKLCGRGLKYWSLRKMVSLGILRTFKKGNDIYFTVKD